MQYNGISVDIADETLDSEFFKIDNFFVVHFVFKDQFEIFIQKGDLF